MLYPWVIPDVSNGRSACIIRVNQTRFIPQDLNPEQNSYKLQAELPYVDVFADGFCSFRACYPEWCESCSELMVSDAGPGSNEVVPLMGLRSLRISATSQLSKVG